MGDRKRDILLGAGVLAIVVAVVWFTVGRDSGGGSSSVAPTERVERPAVNPEEERTMPKEEVQNNEPAPNSQEDLLREENSRAARENAIRILKEGN